MQNARQMGNATLFQGGIVDLLEALWYTEPQYKDLLCFPGLGNVVNRFYNRRGENTRRL